MFTEYRETILYNYTVYESNVCDGGETKATFCEKRHNYCTYSIAKTMLTIKLKKSAFDLHWWVATTDLNSWAVSNSSSVCRIISSIFIPCSNPRRMRNVRSIHLQ